MQPPSASESRMKTELTEELVIAFAQELAADRVPVDKIVDAWKRATDRTLGCLNAKDGQRQFVHNRLIEYGCFDVGCQLEEIRLTCELHMMDPSHWDDQPDWTRDFCRMFFCGDSISQTPISRLIDAKPVNAATKRAHQFPDQ